MMENVKKIDILILLKYLKIVSDNSNILVRFCCLFHKSKSGLSCNINTKNKVYCWGCERAYDVIDIYIKYKKLDFKQDFKKALRDLNSFYNSKEYLEIKNKPADQITITTQNNKTHIFKAPILDDKEIIKQKKRILSDYSPIFDKITNFYHNELLKNKAMLDYLLKHRKLNIDTIKQFKIGYSDINNTKLYKHFSKYKDVLLEAGIIKYNENYNFYYDVMYDCLVLSVLHKGHTMHFYKNNFKTVTRFNPKYKALKSFTNTAIFYYPYGFSIAKDEIKNQQEAIIHEGFYDAINAHQHGIRNAIALISIKSYLSKSVIDFFKKYNVKVVIGLDNDDAGRTNSIRLQMQLNNENIKNEIRYITNDDCKDADDVLKKYGLELYKKIFIN